MNIGDQQLSLAKKSTDYIKELLKNNIDTSSNPFTYFSCWAESLGRCKILQLQGNLNFFYFIKIIIKELWGSYNHSSYKLINTEKLKNFSKIIVTSGYKINFLKNGSIFDSYFKTNSREISDTLWFVLYFDKKIPNKIDKNIILIKKDDNKINFKNFIKIFKGIAFDKSKLKQKLCSVNSKTFFGKTLLKLINKYLMSEHLKTVIMPYEGQPFQQMIFSFLHHQNKKIKTIGYVHDVNPINFHYQFRKGSPLKLLIHSKNHIQYFSKYLNWPRKRLKLIPSLSFRKNKNPEISDGMILLPDFIYNEKKILTVFEEFLNLSQEKNLIRPKVRIHPRSFRIDIQLKLKSSLEILLKKYKRKFSKKKLKKKTIIVIGESSAVVLGLEKGMNVIHICFDPIFQSFSNKIWPSIIVNQISENIFAYKLKVKGKALKFGNERRMLTKYCGI